MLRPPEALVTGAARVRLAPRPIPPRTASVPVLERELKFTVPEERVAVVRHLLMALCRPDAVHPPARVVTVYYDTPDFDSLDEKVNSDYLKTKIRVRWYEPLAGRAADDAVFVEGKYRTGAIRTKVRLRAKAAACDVRRWRLESDAWLGLLDGLRDEGVEVPRGMAPVLKLGYIRERFADPVAGGRLTLDTRIEVDAVSHARVAPGPGGPLRGGVLEHKGTAAELPAHLRLFVRAGARKASFSKYLACYSHVTGTFF